MCGSMLAPKAPSMPAAPAPVEVQNEPQFQAGSEMEDMEAPKPQGTKQLQTHSKSDTGLAIPL